jgi:hypothetical protein
MKENYFRNQRIQTREIGRYENPKSIQNHRSMVAAPNDLEEI